MSGTFDNPATSLSQHKKEFLFKIIVIGDVATGKTSLIQRYVHGTSSSQYKPTLGVDFATKMLERSDSLVRLQFWDVSGQERFANMTRVYYRDSHGAIIVFDCKRQESLNGSFRWKKDLDSKLLLDNGQPIPAVLVANKCDLDHNISDSDLAEFAKQHGFKAAFQISAKTGEGVEKMANYLIRSIINAERDGLYMMPVFQRDSQARQLTGYDDPDNKKKSKSVMRNMCC